jgi:glutamine synthetase
MKSKKIIQTARSSNVKLVRFLYCDNGGVIRGKLTHIEGLSGRLKGGIGLTVAMQAFNMLDQLVPFENMGPVGEVRLFPDPATFKILPYTPHAAAMLCDLMTLDRQPWEACPRNFLKRMIARAAEHNIVAQASMENEFILCQEVDGKLTPADHALCLSTVGMHEASAVVDDLLDAFEAMGIQVELYYPEYGPGQHELTIHHTDALSAADQQIYYRDTVRSVARNHNLFASLAPKPFPEAPGSGCHIHCSLWDKDNMNNLLWDKHDPYHISDLGHHFIAGILAHLPALVALTAPSFNSYRRLRPHSWASAFTAWGPDNREAAVRIASPFWGQEESSINFELKSSDTSNNPYLALGGLIAAGIDGVARQLDPGEPMLEDPSDMSDSQLKKRGIRRLPINLKEALDNLEKDDVLMEALNPILAGSYLAVKKSEYEAFSAQDEDFEIRHHIYTF